MKRTTRDLKPVVVDATASDRTKRLAAAIAKLNSHAEYDFVAREWHGPIAIDIAKRGRSLRELARATGLSPTYLSLVANGRQRISLYAMHALLCQCEGVKL